VRERGREKERGGGVEGSCSYPALTLRWGDDGIGEKWRLASAAAASQRGNEEIASKRESEVGVSERWRSSREVTEGF